MRIKDAFIIAINNAFKQKSGSLLTILSITIGIASVLLVSSIGNSGERIIEKELENIGVNGISIYRKDATDGVPLVGKDAEALKNKFKNIQYISPMIADQGTIKFNKLNSDAILLGIGEDAGKIYNVTLLHGRLPSEFDIRSGNSVALIDNELAEKVYKRTNVINKKIVMRINGKSMELRIIGVIKTQKELIDSISNNRVPNLLYVPYTTLNNLRDTDQINHILLKTSQESEVEQYTRFLSVKKSVKNGYSSENLSTYVNNIKSITGIVSLVISAIAAISLFVAGIGIMNSTFSAARDRKKEIGICIAVGAEKGDIFLLFLLEAMIVSICGGVVGGAIGYLITVLINNIISVNLIFNVKIFFTAEVLAIFLGILFAIVPAMKAASLNPIDALSAT